MTKQVRIENADTSDFKIIVETWDKSYPPGGPDILAKTQRLNHPCFMTNDTYITSTRYLVVREVGPEDEANV